MIALRVTETYVGLFLTSKYDDGSRIAAIARIGTFEVRLVEMPPVNASESLWVELYNRDLQVGIDSCKCSDLDEAIDAAQLMLAQARRLNNEAGEAACAVAGA